MSARIWHYYLPSQDPEGEYHYPLVTSLTSPESVAEEAFRDYWNNHDGYELGTDLDYDLVLIDPGCNGTRWSVRAELSVEFRASPAAMEAEGR